MWPCGRCPSRIQEPADIVVDVSTHFYCPRGALTSKSSALAPATPFLPPLTRTSSGVNDSRVLPSHSVASRGKVIFTPYLSSNLIAYLPF